MATISLARTVSISLFSRSKVFYSNMIYRQSGFDPMAHVTTQGTYPNLYTLACFGLAGATAGTAISVVACPFELTKLSAQVSVLLADRKNTTDRKAYEVAASYHNKGTFKTMANIVRHRGFMGLYTGFKLHCGSSHNLSFHSFMLITTPPLLPHTANVSILYILFSFRES